MIISSVSCISARDRRSTLVGGTRSSPSEAWSLPSGFPSWSVEAAAGSKLSKESRYRQETVSSRTSWEMVLKESRQKDFSSSLNKDNFVVH